MRRAAKLPAKSSSSINLDSLPNGLQNADVSCSDSLTQLVREFIVAFGAASNMVRITWTNESDATLPPKSYGIQGSAVSLPNNARLSELEIKSLQ